MKKIILILLIVFASCVDKKEKPIDVPSHKVEEAMDAQATNPVAEDIVEEEIKEADAYDLPYTNGVLSDFAGEYKLVEGKTYFLDLKEDTYYKAAIVFEKLSDTDYGYYYTDKRKNISPIGHYGIVRLVNHKFHQLRMHEGYSENNSTNAFYIGEEVKLILAGNHLGMITYGGNFRKYMWYQKKNSQDKYHLSLTGELEAVKRDYKKSIEEYNTAKNYNKDKPKFKSNGGYVPQDPNLDEKFKSIETRFLQQVKNPDFASYIKAMQIKRFPKIEDTNFDSFIDPDDFKDVDVKTLQLESIYPNFYKEGYDYRAIASYKIELSEDFHSVVVTLKKGDHEMETTLINYDLSGKIIDHQIIAYDEIAESMSRVVSKITQNMLRVHHTFYSNETEIKQVTYEILSDGIIDGLDSRVLNNELQHMPLLLITLNELKLNSVNVKMELIASKPSPDNPDDIIMVIPEIVEEDEHYYEYNTHIAIVNARSGDVMGTYFESSKTNGWISDAIELREFKIDTAPYRVTDSDRAFGVRVYFYGSPHPNPYSNETLSLFINQDRKLKKALHNYEVMNYGGEWDTDCLGAFTDIKKTLAITDTMTNGYYDINVNSTITETENFVDDNGDCDSKESVSKMEKVLKFDGEMYN